MPSTATSWQQKLSLADGSHIRAAMLRLIHEFKAGRWLGPQNPYRTDTIAAIRRHTQAGGCLQHQDLIEYIAVSAIHHCFDGWSYLGRALQAEMACDPDAARHLGYYAELRAAMGLLASEGIGVFNNTHFVVCSEGKCHPVRRAGGTHQFVWEALEVWANAKAKDVLLRVVILSGVPLSDWLSQFRSGGVQWLAADWLKSWGLDLKRYTEDRDARNTSSYQPTALVSSGPRPIDKIMSTVVQLWNGCEPTGSAAFHGLDRWLLRFILETVFRTSHGKSAQEARENYLNRVDTMLEGVGLSDVARGDIRRFLDPSETRSSSEILADASSKLTAEHVDHSKQLLARATLLLRFATGCTRELLVEASTSPQGMLRFWWSQPRVRRGLWPTEDSPSTFSDLWEDVSEALDGVDRWMNDPTSRNCAYDLWTKKRAADAAILSTTERICLWGLGL